MGAIQRILEYIELKGISKYKFYKKTGLSNGFLGKGENIGSDKCEIILSCFPDINSTWLLTGKGKMLLKQDSDPDIKIISGMNNKNIQTSIINNSQVRNSPQIKNDDRSDPEINALKAKIEFLEVMLKEKDKMIAEKERYIVLLEQQINKQ